jgi:hypothetical protein
VSNLLASDYTVSRERGDGERAHLIPITRNYSLGEEDDERMI